LTCSDGARDEDPEVARAEDRSNTSDRCASHRAWGAVGGIQTPRATGTWETLTRGVCTLLEDVGREDQNAQRALALAAERRRYPQELPADVGQRAARVQERHKEHSHQLRVAVVAHPKADTARRRDEAEQQTMLMLLQLSQTSALVLQRVRLLGD
jgi:hypothetical protein